MTVTASPWAGFVMYNITTFDTDVIRGPLLDPENGGTF